MKLFKLFGIMVLATGVIMFAGCGTDDDVDTDTDGDTGVEATDTGGDDQDDLDAGDTDGDEDTGLDTDQTDTDVEDDTDTDVVDDRTDVEIYCDQVCQFIYDCEEEEGMAEEDSFEECVDGCTAQANDHMEDNADCTQAMMDAHTCFLQLSCEEAISLFSGEIPITTNNHVCYDAWKNWETTCHPPLTVTEVMAICEAQCILDYTDCEEDGEEGDENDYTSQITECIDYCFEDMYILVTHSRQCGDAFTSITECYNDNICEEIAEGEAPPCEDAENDMETACDPSAVFAPQCAYLCERTEGMELEEGMDEDFCFCGHMLYVSYLRSDDCGQATTELLACVEQLEGEDWDDYLENGPTEDGACGPQQTIMEQVCDFDF